VRRLGDLGRARQVAKVQQARERRRVGRQARERQRGRAARSDGEAAWLANLTELENRDGEQSI
jgi:hypothetical protein